LFHAREIAGLGEGQLGFVNEFHQIFQSESLRLLRPPLNHKKRERFMGLSLSATALTGIAAMPAESTRR
jgi:hypothetical protein